MVSNFKLKREETFAYFTHYILMQIEKSLRLGGYHPSTDNRTKQTKILLFYLHVVVVLKEGLAFHVHDINIICKSLRTTILHVDLIGCEYRIIIV